ncbi:MAG: PEP-CTERM sorting domain-containing protein [Planctomycetota bacterium]
MTSSGNGLGINTRGGVFNPTTWEGGGNGAISAGINFTLNTDFFIVGKFDWGATSGDVDTVTLYNPALNDLTNLGTGFSRSTSAGVDQTAFDTLSISIRNSGGANIYDEIRFGATLDDVTPIPEASSLALLGLGGILVARRRRA